MSFESNKQPPKILVIDDDTNLVEAITSFLNHYGFESRGLSQSPQVFDFLQDWIPDILVLDLMMPQLNGLQLLEKLRRLPRFRHLPVLILTAVNDRRGILSAAKLKVSAYMIKPFEPQSLLDKVEDILIERGLPLPANRRKLSDGEEPLLDNYDKTVLLDLSKVDELPAMPFIVNEVREAMQDKTLDAKLMARTIEKDQAIVGQLLRIANSVHYAQSREVIDIDQAVVVVGFKEVYNIVITLAVMKEFQFSDESSGLSSADFWAHSFAVATLARQLAGPAECRQPGDVFIGGIVHDLGKCLINLLCRGSYHEVIALAQQKECYLRDIEQEKLGVTHTQVGGQAARSWEFPPLIRDAMRLHHIWHYGSIDSPDEIRSLRCIYIADHLSRAAGMGHDAENLIESVPAALWKELGCENPRRIWQVVEEGIRDWARFLQPLGISSLKRYFDVESYLREDTEDQRLPIHIIDMRRRPLSTPYYLLMNSNYRPVYHFDLASCARELKESPDIAGIVIQGMDPVLAKTFYQELRQLPLSHIEHLPVCYIREINGGSNDEKTLSLKAIKENYLQVIQEPFSKNCFNKEIENYISEFRRVLSDG